MKIILFTENFQMQRSYKNGEVSQGSCRYFGNLPGNQFTVKVAVDLLVENMIINGLVSWVEIPCC